MEGYGISVGELGTLERQVEGGVVDADTCGTTSSSSSALGNISVGETNSLPAARVAPKRWQKISFCLPSGIALQVADAGAIAGTGGGVTDADGGVRVADEGGAVEDASDTGTPGAGARHVGSVVARVAEGHGRSILAKSDGLDGSA